jgi:long-chain acyl-CoA synthetase
MKLLSELLDRVTEKYAARPALHFIGDGPTWTWTYADLHAQTDRIAAALHAQGVRPGDRVIFWAPNSPWWVAAYFAVLRLGGIVVPLDARNTPDFVDRVAAQTEPVLGLLAAATAPGWDSRVPTRLLESFADLPAAPPPPVPDDLGPRNLAVIAFTSGTTGDPKGVMLTHGNILADAINTNKHVPEFPAYRLLSILPLSHMLEQVVGLLLPLLRGAGVTYTASRQSTVLFRAIHEQHITTILLVPQAVELLMNAVEQEVRAQGKEALWRRMQQVAGHLPHPARRLLFRQVHQRLGGHIDFLMSGGARLDPALIHKWDLLGVPVLQGYGTTEAAPVITIDSLEAHIPAAVGKPIPGAQIRLAPDGEILTRGPNVTPGYWKNPTATAEAFEDGWYKTGDLGEIDEHGFLYIKGRKKDRIVLSSGQKVYPDDIEPILKAVPGVADATVVGMDSPHGPVVHAVVIPRSPEVDIPAVIREANAVLGTYQQIRGYSAWPESDFPRNALGKVKKFQVVAALAQSELATPVPERVLAPATTPAGRLMRITAEVAHVDPATLTPSATLGEGAGLDSLMQIELLAGIERELGVHLDEANIGPTTTLGELLTMIEHRPAAPRTADAVPAGISGPQPAKAAAVPATPAVVRSAGKALWYHKAFRLVARTVFGFCYRVRITGKRNLPPTPAILCSNHLGYGDLFTPLFYLPTRPLIHVVGEEHVKHVSGFRNWLIDYLNIMVPVDRSKPLEALYTMVDVLHAGGSLLMYPEGVVSHTEGALQPLQEGAAHAAILAGVPLVPMGITGAADLWFRKPLALRIGPPIHPADFAGDLDTRRHAMTAELAVRMQAVLPGEPPYTGPKLLKNWLTHLF